MTLTADPPRPAPAGDPTEEPVERRAAPTTVDAEERAPIRPVALAVGWTLITVVGIVLALIAVGPVSEERDQRALLDGYRTEIEDATNEAFGLAGIEVPTQAPAPGTAVAVIDIDRLQLSRVVVEGSDPEQTREGPGHVVGTGGPGQPGNSVIVARRGLFGGAFGSIDALQPGDRILVTTTQGRSVYEVDHVGTHTIDAPAVEAASTSSATTVPAAEPSTTLPPADATSAGASGEEEAATPEVTLPDGRLTVDQVYGPSPDDRLTLVTSASSNPLGSSEAVVVVAHLDGEAFAPTPQGGRTPGDDGRRGGTGTTAAFVLALLAYVAGVVGAIWLHRNVPWRSAYLLSAPILVALTIVLADQIATALPAWT